MRVQAVSFARRLRLATALAASLIAFVPISAQAPADPLERTITVSVTNEQGKNLRGLEAKYFRAQFRGKPVQILSAVEGPTHRVVLLYDVSGSMQSSRPAARMAAERFLALMPPQVPVAFLSFATRVSDPITFGTDRGEIISELHSVESLNWDKKRAKEGGRTAIFDAISEAIELFREAQPGDSIFIITDGGENASHLQESQVRQKARASGIRIFSVLELVSLEARPRSFEEAEGPGALYELGKSTGGDTWSFDVEGLNHYLQEVSPRHHDSAEKHLASVLSPMETLVREMNGFYVLKIHLPEPVEKAQHWKLEVMELETGKPDHHLILHYPSQLMPVATAGP